ncbi:MAG: 5'-nucleotidase C-terminal domain-containing protein [Actinocatenispora sp.]
MNKAQRTRALRALGVLTAGLCAAGLVTAIMTPADASPRPVHLTVLGTTDVHGHAINWDYYKNKPYSDASGNSVGFAQISTVVNQVRAEKGKANTLLVDAGDVIQGTPLDSYYSTVEPITETGATHPMAAAMNAMHYDAGAVGNHEYNFGVDYLRAYQKQLNFPLLDANAMNHRTGNPAFQPYVIRTLHPKGAKPVKVGFIGLSTPGSAIWDGPKLVGRVDVTGVLEGAKRWVPRVRAAGADVVIAVAHSGIETSSSYGDALPWPENDMREVAEKVPGIDAILAGHTHQNNEQVIATNKQTGHKVVISQPGMWGQRVSQFDITLDQKNGHYQLGGLKAKLLDPTNAAPDPKVVAATKTQHDKTVTYVNSVIGQSTDDMSSATARYEDAAAVDFINKVQTDVVTGALAGTENADLPVLSIAAPFNRDSGVSKGDVTVRDIAGLYEYDNTLLGVKMTGAQIKPYLEKSAEYYQQISGTGPFTPDQLTNAKTTDSPNGTPDYLYDVMSGLKYNIDIAKPAGQRIVDLTYNGKPVDDTQQFVLAINNYRQSGGGNFPGVKDMPVVWDEQVEIRQSLIDWVKDKGTVDPATFFTQDWSLLSDGQPIQING